MTTPAKKFHSIRAEELLKGQRIDLELRMVNDVEEFGCFVLSVSSSVGELSWSYTLGVFETCGKPEIVTVGLPPKTAHSALNDAARAMHAGADLTIGRHHEMVGEVQVIFRPVDPEWVKQLMGSAKWFNGSWDFPVLQMIYPDLENRFQWEEGFAEYFRQPLLQANAPQTVVEKDFKASLDPKSSLFDWKFPDHPHTQAYLSQTVNDGEEAVTYISHDASDGAWQFLGDKMSEGGGPVLSCLHHPIDKDQTLKELADLPVGWYAERDDVGSPWIRHMHEDENPE